jgi:hypothetical protein
MCMRTCIATCLLSGFVVVAAAQSVPQFDFDVTTPGVQGPGTPEGTTLEAVAHRQHQVEVLVCAPLNETGVFFAPHLVIASPSCNGGALVTIVIILNEIRQSASGQLAPPVSRILLVTSALSSLTGQVERIISDTLPVRSLEIKESGAVRTYAVEVIDTAGRTARIDVSGPSDSPAYLQENPAQNVFRNLSDGAAFVLARGSFLSSTPAVGAVRIKMPKSGYLQFGSRLFFAGDPVGRVNFRAPTVQHAFAF